MTCWNFFILYSCCAVPFEAAAPLAFLYDGPNFGPRIGAQPSRHLL